MSWALLAVAPFLSALQEDDRTKRILERIEREIQLSETRLRDEIRAILRAELGKRGAEVPPPTVPAQPRRRVFIGITADDFTDAERKRLGVGGGIKVADVRGPAAKAGLQAGDILLSLDGQPVSEETIGGLLEQKSPGDAVAAVVLRGSERKTLKIVLEERRD